jgi:hypothetical protein
MKTKILFTTALLAVSSITNADTLSNLLNDIPKNVTTVQKTGTCDTNLELHVIQEQNSSREELKPNDSPCDSVVAQCPQGKTVLPKLSKCEITFIDSAVVKDPQYGFYKDENTGRFVMGDSVTNVNLAENNLKCNVQLSPYSYFPTPDGRNYTNEGYTQYDVTVKATAKCINTPANLFKKLGVTFK